MKMVGGTRIIGQDMVCGFSNGKYTQFEGTEIVAENCVKARVKDLVVEGKTIQDTEDLSNIESVGENEDNLVTIRNYNYKCDTDNVVLPDGTKNEISYSDGKHIHTRKIGKYIISGGSNETISIRKNLNNSEYITFNVSVKNNMETAFKDYSLSKIKMICDKLEISLNEFLDTVDKITKEAICMRNSGLGFGISILRSKLETEDAKGFRTWLLNNPITVYYELYSFVDTDLYYDDITYKLSEPLRSLPDGVCDTIEEGKIVRRVGKVIFDGSENWQTGDSLVSYILFNCKSYCSGIANITYGNLQDTSKTYIYAGNNNSFEIHLEGETKTTSKTAKEYLSKNPVTVYYELAEPIIHDLEIPSISTTKGTNIITTSNNIKPKLKLKVKVKK